MKIIKITGIFLIVNLFISGFSIPAQAGVFDKFGVGARPISMGHTYIACGEGPETIFYNPAGLTLEKSPELSAMYANLYSLDLLNYYFLGLLYPGIAYGTIGLSMIYLGTSNNPSLASLDHSQNNILLSYAYRLSPYFNLGLNIKAFFVRS
ncbi:MAG: hypothetical protein JW827_12220, partial [Spirochaetes bacterium]|nr:hypothetical protein [Spirochaetota bacterium]